MTKQEKIREGIAHGLWELIGDGFDFDTHKGFYLQEADKLIAYLHSQGVVIDVGDRWNDVNKCYSKVVEPLIKEE